MLPVSPNVPRESGSVASLGTKSGGRKVELVGRILTIDNFGNYTNLFVCRDSQGRIEGSLLFGSTSFSFSFVGVRLTF